MEVRELLSKYEFPGDDILIVQVSALKALEGDPSGRRRSELMAAADSYIPELTRDIDKPFLMPIEDVFTITGRGTVVTGRIEQGKIEVGNEVEIVGIHEKVEKTTVTGLEMFQKILDFAQAGDNGGRCSAASSARRSSAARCSKLGLDHAAHALQGRGVRAPRRTRAGRHTPPSTATGRSSTSADDASGSTAPEGQEMVMPGDNTNMEIELIQPIAMDQGLRRDPRGRRTVGAGVVTEIVK